VEEGESLADHGGGAVGRETDGAAVVAATASVVRRRPSTDQTERDPLRARPEQFATRRHVSL